MKLIKTFDGFLRGHFNFESIVKSILAISLIQLVVICLGVNLNFIHLAIPLLYFFTRKTASHVEPSIGEFILHFSVVILVILLPSLFPFKYIGSLIFAYVLTYLMLIYKEVKTIKPSSANQSILGFIGFFCNYMIACLIAKTIFFLVTYIYADFGVEYVFFQTGLSVLVLLFSLLSLVNINGGNKAILNQVPTFMVNKADIQSYSYVVEDKERTIVDFFETSDEFLTNSFSLDDLAEAVGLSKQEVSTVINHQLNSSFYHMVAQYRILHAKELLQERNNLTIEAIVEECGFSSKSTFNKYFKLFVGKTPSVYRSQIA
ncbi:AraC family transcriptional regulator [Myroides sp. 1354]|uniref:helix-turn-helix domain-containing protein n=1 Tax=unclassified Myroides TaxID=2642485 RepID=UPI0025769CE4|nr:MULTISPECIES: helix-turn-helix domain-containing protein [unclassified Myroides]MDM1046120.1 AraC family transcriptional regulator [Myroides sp. R163-1]MDM1057057.1 AraC family transcriptional regulator [Myroides sp. 1354]MDM1070251.1 AraC family transcriptional regulator [Myroides sp. 1372]